MSTPITKQVELERLARAVLETMFAGINSQIAAQNTLWDARDASFATALGRTDPQISAETIENENFYVGHVPSLINADLERYPNIAVMAYTATPNPGSGYDWSEDYVVTLAVEIMCRSTRTEEEVNSRVLRTVEAAHQCLMSDDARRLQGLTPQVPNAPTITIGDVFIKREGHGHGDVWYWQGGRLEYRLPTTVSY